ncbi:phage tail protein [Hydrogenophilus thermoluteolus]|uniref:Phage tail protein n=1 Tax=Hydrogenophilus thermoluteolus TaxID=297 RepID=A0A2Z6DXP1_HYDTE|nr:phage tail protein [Hydrogenophilus thermoluteolus]BBD77251.1 phage tail protein [Hydrogenophilus thermoluteolus]
MADRLAPDLLALDPRFGPLAEATQRIEALPLDGLLTYLIDTVPAHYLPELGRQFHIMPLEGWQFAATDAERRRLIRESIALHRRKGTPWSIRRMLEIAGFGAGLRISEGRVARRFDGTIFADGSEIYGGHSWAEFAIDVDLGDTAGLDAETSARIREIVEEWKPESRHLTRLAFHADTSDAAPSSEAAQTNASWSGASLRPWRRCYDGALFYDQGALLAYNGATRADGSSAYQGWTARGATWLAGAPESDTTLALIWTDTDRQQALPTYDGATQADGTTDYGDTAPVAQDAVMPITVTRHVRYDGRYRYGADNLFDGSARFDGARRYIAGRVASGNESFYLEAA